MSLPQGGVMAYPMMRVITQSNAFAKEVWIYLWADVTKSSLEKPGRRLRRRDISKVV